MSYVLAALIILGGLLVAAGVISIFFWIADRTFEKTGNTFLAMLVFFLLFSSPLLVMGTIDLGNYLK